MNTLSWACDWYVQSVKISADHGSLTGVISRAWDILLFALCCCKHPLDLRKADKFLIDHSLREMKGIRNPPGRREDTRLICVGLLYMEQGMDCAYCWLSHFTVQIDSFVINSSRFGAFLENQVMGRCRSSCTCLNGLAADLYYNLFGEMPLVF